MFVKFKYRVFYNEDSGYSVCQYKSLDLEKNIICIGINLPTIKNITYDFTAEEYSTAKYGKSYKVIAWDEYINKTKEDIVAYLSCGLFSGISEKTALKIYEVYKDKTIDILDSDIDKLIEVPGIGNKTLAKIKISYIEKRASREIAKKLVKYGISMSAINRIYMRYKADAINIISEKPYELCSVRGITFPMIDKVAKDLGFAPDSYERIKAASDYVLTEDMACGNVCMEKDEFAIKLIHVLATSLINRDNILGHVLKLIKDGTVRYNKRISSEGKKEFFYYPATYKAERSVASSINLLLKESKKTVTDIDDLIDRFSGDIVLDETQKEAIKIGVTEPVFIITGGPGTGKTTILKIIAQINEYLNDGEDVNIFLSPTGRAARRITESTGYPAKTIHSALGLNIIDDERFINDDDASENLIEDSCVIVDEASMIDLWVMDGLLRNIRNCSLGLIGDIDQLPSVRCGSILRDLIACGKIPCVQLDHIHRQSADAMNICVNAQNIKNGIHKLETGEDFEIIDADDLAQAEKSLVESALKNIYLYGLENVKVLCPFKKNICGVYRVNTILQNEINPSKIGELELKIPNDMVLRIGDPVMQLKNIDDVANGDVGFVNDIDSEEIEVIYPGETSKTVEYTYTEAKEQLTLAYATTVHKSQGSEYDAVVFCLTKKHGLMKRRNILYTGITRGRHKVVLIGNEDAFNESIDNNMIEDRHSMLADLLNPSNDSYANHQIMILPPKVGSSYEQIKLPFV